MDQENKYKGTRHFRRHRRWLRRYLRDLRKVFGYLGGR